MHKLQASFSIYCQDPSNYCFIARASATSFFICFAKTSETAFSHQTAESDQQKSNFVSFDVNTLTNTVMGSRFFLQDIFSTQGSNPGLLHCRQTPYCLSHQGSPQEDKKDIKNQLSPPSQHGGRKEWQTWQWRAIEHKDISGETPSFWHSGSGRSSTVNILDPICVQVSDNCLTQYIQ